jgi:hypothetical protein
MKTKPVMVKIAEWGLPDSTWLLPFAVSAAVLAIAGTIVFRVELLLLLLASVWCLYAWLWNVRSAK